MIGKLGLELLEHFEGLRLTAYPDSGGLFTIGFGTTVYPSGQKVKEFDRLRDADQALSLLRNDLKNVELVISKLVEIPLDQWQFDALCCFTYNVGVNAFAHSTLLKKINSKAPEKEIEAEFNKWSYCKGKIIPGLLRRRKSEYSLYLTGKPKYIFL